MQTLQTLIMTSYDPVMLVKPEEFKTLVNYYKGNITESTLLNKAARVAAETRVLIDDETIAPDLKETQMKEMMRKRSRLAKELRQSAVAIPSASGGDDDRKDSLQEHVLKGVAKNINKQTAAVGEDLKDILQQRQQPQQGPSAVSTSKIPTPIKKEPVKKRKFQSKIPTPIKKEPVKKRKFQSKIPTPIKKKKKTEVEKLQEDGGWIAWEKRGWDPVKAFEDEGDDDDEDDEDDYDVESDDSTGSDY